MALILWPEGPELGRKVQEHSKKETSVKKETELMVFIGRVDLEDFIL
jgi:hypothetical protein